MTISQWSPRPSGNIDIYIITHNLRKLQFYEVLYYRVLSIRKVETHLTRHSVVFLEETRNFSRSD